MMGQGTFSHQVQFKIDLLKVLFVIPAVLTKSFIKRNIHYEVLSHPGFNIFLSIHNN